MDTLHFGPRVFDLIGIGAVNVDLVVAPGAVASIDALRTLKPDHEEPFQSLDALREALDDIKRNDHPLRSRVGGSAFNALHVAGRLERGLRLLALLVGRPGASVSNATVVSLETPLSFVPNNRRPPNESSDAQTYVLIQRYADLQKLPHGTAVLERLDEWKWPWAGRSASDKQRFLDPVIAQVRRAQRHEDTLLFLLIVFEPIRRSISTAFRRASAGLEPPERDMRSVEACAIGTDASGPAAVAPRVPHRDPRRPTHRWSRLDAMGRRAR